MLQAEMSNRRKSGQLIESVVSFAWSCPFLSVGFYITKDSMEKGMKAENFRIRPGKYRKNNLRMIEQNDEIS
jgi:hypothetical protein